MGGNGSAKLGHCTLARVDTVQISHRSREQQQQQQPHQPHRPHRPHQLKQKDQSSQQLQTNGLGIILLSFGMEIPFNGPEVGTILMGPKWARF